METNNENNFDNLKNDEQNDIVKSRTIVDEKGELFNVDDFAKEHGLGNTLDDANENVILLARLLYQNH